MGDILNLAARYKNEGADELVFYDITASPDKRVVDRTWVNAVASILNIPFCVAGGIRSIDDAEEILNRGADKISINTPALINPDLINILADRFGSQCVVIGIDSLLINNEYYVYKYTGNTKLSSSSNRKTKDWAKEVQKRGAGEIVLNCMNKDGVQEGYDISQLQKIRKLCKVPLIASGGAGKLSHFDEVFNQANVDGALAASIFHSGKIPINDLKKYLISQKINVRPVKGEK